MKWLEIIEFRSINSNYKEIEAQLRKMIKEISPGKTQYKIKLYARKEVETDFSIHILHHTKIIKVGKNSISNHISAILKEYGLVKNKIWIEERGRLAFFVVE